MSPRFFVPSSDRNNSTETQRLECDARVLALSASSKILSYPTKFRFHLLNDQLQHPHRFMIRMSDLTHHVVQRGVFFGKSLFQKFFPAVQLFSERRAASPAMTRPAKSEMVDARARLPSVYPQARRPGDHGPEQ